jgi:outer membrane murein-binding lipoprotein Lpp
MNTPRIAVVLLGAAALSGIGLAGCGGSDSTTSAATSQADGAAAEPRLTDAQYVAAANKVCAATETATQAVPEPTTPEEFGPYLEKVADAGQDGVDGLSGLYPPADLQAAHDRLVAAETQAVALARSLASDAAGATSAADIDKIAARIDTPEFQDVSKEIDAAAKAAGVEDCGEDGADAN